MTLTASPTVAQITLADINALTGLNWRILEDFSATMYGGTNASVVLVCDSNDFVLSHNPTVLNDGHEWFFSIDNGDTFFMTAVSLIELLTKEECRRQFKGDLPIRGDWRSPAKPKNRPDGWWNCWGLFPR
jgi:hypothetical protein